jgi:hypothetical protein
VADGAGKTKHYSIDGPVFSPDSSHVAYLASNGNKYFLAVDGMKTQEYDCLVPYSTIVFDSPTKCHALMEKDNKIFLVEIEIPQ